ncbi:MAG: SpoVR family protein, partial [bacterium]|nr:SpoVR family protein [bacterium]
MNMTPHGTLLFESADWDFSTLERIQDACEKIALPELGLNVYPNQLEVVSSEQMLDAYTSHGVPLMYKHWSFGKHFLQHEAPYKAGHSGLAYELVINSSPCISYLMEENTATMQTLVIGHAAFGHNHFFKNNYLFKEWTDAEGILDYLEYAKKYIAHCEDLYGEREVERVLDSAHALMSHGVFRYRGKRRVDLGKEEKRAVARAQEAERNYNDLWEHTVPRAMAKSHTELVEEKRRVILGLPEENILYFLEKKSPKLQVWQREILRIVRHIAQYFYPQGQTKVMNEGCATYVHYQIMNKLCERGQISDGNFQEFLVSHTGVITQLPFNHSHFGGFNPYALGFAMMQDIERIVSGKNPLTGEPCTAEEIAEDREWFPNLAGKGDGMGALHDAWANYRDESFIAQYLSPRLIRKMGMFYLEDDPDFKAGILVRKIHNDYGYREIRRTLAKMHDIGHITPVIEIVDVDLMGNRRLILQHKIQNGALLEKNDLLRVLKHLADLWGYEV